MRINNWQRFYNGRSIVWFEKKFPCAVKEKKREFVSWMCFYFQRRWNSFTTAKPHGRPWKQKIKTSKGKYNNNRACCQENGDQSHHPSTTHCSAAVTKKVGTRSTRGFYSSCCFGSRRRRKKKSLFFSESKGLSCCCCKYKIYFLFLAAIFFKLFFQRENPYVHLFRVFQIDKNSTRDLCVCVCVCVC